MSLSRESTKTDIGMLPSCRSPGASTVYIRTSHRKVRSTAPSSPPATLAKGPERHSGSIDCFPAVRVLVTLRPNGGTCRPHRASLSVPSFPPSPTSSVLTPQVCSSWHYTLDNRLPVASCVGLRVCRFRRCCRMAPLFVYSYLRLAAVSVKLRGFAHNVSTRPTTWYRSL